MAAIKTLIRIPSTDSVFNIPNEWKASDIQANYAASFPGIATMTVVTNRLTTPEGEVLEHTFSPRTGNKG